MSVKRAKVIFDVGANDGGSCLHHAINDPYTVVYAFEPTPRMAQIIRDKTAHLPNYHVVQVACSDVKSTATLYVAGQADWGCTSLCNFNDNLLENWHYRTPEFKVTDQIDVPVIRLEEFVESHGIEEIEYYHCDVQGKDLEALMGMGVHLRKIKAGIIEMPSNHNTKLYKDQKYISDDAVAFLKQNGFDIVQIRGNDEWWHEVNIWFKRNDAFSSSSSVQDSSVRKIRRTRLHRGSRSRS